MSGEPEIQRIARLTPLAEVRKRIAMVAPVAAREVAIDAALFRALAEDVRAPAGLPAQALVLRDGYAIRAEEVAEAGPYIPVPLQRRPVNVGNAMPPGTDAVAPLDAVVERGDQLTAVASVGAGEGVLQACADVRAGDFIACAGWRLNEFNIAMLALSGSTHVPVREPRLRLVSSRREPDAIVDAVAGLLTRALRLRGCMVQQSAGDLADALTDSSADAIVGIGGTGSGRNDASVTTLARHGDVEAYGIAIAPGETAAFGMSGMRPVLLLPGRIDSAIAGWLTMGVPLIDRLSGSSDAADPFVSASLTRKVASPLGLAEVVPVRLLERKAEPIASGYWPLAALAGSDGWILVPADSEGFPAGADVMVRPWP